MFINHEKQKEKKKGVFYRFNRIHIFFLLPIINFTSQETVIHVGSLTNEKSFAAAFV